QCYRRSLSVCTSPISPPVTPPAVAVPFSTSVSPVDVGGCVIGRRTTPGATQPGLAPLPPRWRNRTRTRGAAARPRPAERGVGIPFQRTIRLRARPAPPLPPASPYARVQAPYGSQRAAAGAVALSPLGRLAEPRRQ